MTPWSCFFGGHGAIDAKRGGEFFFVPHDADPDYLGATCVLMSGLRFLEKLSAPRVLLIADACHSGGFSNSQTKSIARSLQSFLKEFRESTGRVIITASKPDEYALELPGIDNGAFTHFLLEGLRGKADQDRDGLVTVREAYEYVYRKTKEVSDGAQYPGFEGRLTGAFPISYLHAPGPLLEMLTPPPAASICIRDKSRFRYLKKSDENGEAAFKDLPFKKPVIVMVKKPGWKEKILDPLVLTDENTPMKLPPVKLEPALAFLVLRTSAPIGPTTRVRGKRPFQTGLNERARVRAPRLFFLTIPQACD